MYDSAKREKAVESRRSRHLSDTNGHELFPKNSLDKHFLEENVVEITFRFAGKNAKRSPFRDFSVECAKRPARRNAFVVRRLQLTLAATQRGARTAFTISMCDP